MSDIVMKFLQSIFGKKHKHPPIQGDLSAFVIKSIPIIGIAGKTMEDHELIQLLASEDVPEQEAIEIVLFFPVAVARKLMPEIKWKDYYIDYYGDNKQIEQLYRENPRYVIFESEVHRFLNSKPGSELILNIAGRSAEFKAVNKLLLDGSKIEDITVTASYVVR
jgi:hypothetical protein